MAHEVSLPSQTVYSLLRSQAQVAAQLVVRETGVRTGQGAVCHALDLDGRPLVLVPLPLESDLAEDSSGRAVTLRKRVLLQRGHERSFAAVRCEDPELDRQFSVFADDLISALETVDVNPIAATREVLDQWRSLFEKLPARLLGQNALTGLLGELHLLEALTARDPGQALSRWRGWDRARHDFQSEDVAVEVKTTTNRQQFTVEVTGFWQLDPPHGKSLYVLAEQFEQVATGGDAVPDAIERIIKAGIPASDIYAVLAELGYHGGDADAYRRLRFARLQARLCAVQEGFPRIVRGSFTDPGLADRILGLRYSIDVGAFPESPQDPIEQAAGLLVPHLAGGTQS